MRVKTESRYDNEVSKANVLRIPRSGDLRPKVGRIKEYPLNLQTISNKLKNKSYLKCHFKHRYTKIFT